MLGTTQQSGRSIPEFGVRCAFQFWICHILAVWLCAHYLTSVSSCLLKTIKGSLLDLRLTSMKVASMAIGIQQVLGVIPLESLASLHLPLCRCSINMGLQVGSQSGVAHSIRQHIPLSILCLCSIPSSNCLDLKEESCATWRELRGYTVFPLVFIDEQIRSK